MTRIALIVLEILVGVAAVGGEVYLILTSRDAFADEPGLTPAKTRVIVDLVMLDLIVAVMVISAWLVYGGSSWARVLSIIGGMVVGGFAALRPTLTGSRQAVSTAFVLLGLAVVLLGIVLPSPG
jgi:hypothetical protein